MATDGRQLWLANKLAEAFDVSLDTAEKAVLQRKEAVAAFYEPEGPSALTWFYQTPTGKPLGSPPQLFLGNPQREVLANKAVYFVRTGAKGVSDKTCEADIAIGEVPMGALDAFRALMAELYLPMLSETGSWGHSTDKQSHAFLKSANKLTSALTEAAATMAASVELKAPDQALLEGLDTKPATLGRAAADDSLVAHVAEVLMSWCASVDQALTQPPPQHEGSEAGPRAELELWRARLAALTRITEQLKGRDCRIAIGVAGAARCKAYKAWREAEAKLTDSINEARDNLKYLRALDASWEPLYQQQSLAAVHNCLPAVLSNICTMHTVSRYYASPERLTAFLQSVTAQLIDCCRGFLGAAGRLWDQDKPTLIANLGAVIGLRDAYLDAYRRVREGAGKVDSAVGRFEANEAAVFGRMDLFAKRCRKLIELFTIIHQFSELAKHTHIEGLQPIMKRFGDIVEEVRRKPYDLLDAAKNIFDRDFLEFNVHINDLELAVQGFVHASFEGMKSTDSALRLLRQFRSVLQRDSLRADLDAMYSVIFQRYAKDVEAVQAAYERGKRRPMLPRGTPPVTGHILWARQLLRRIEAPMLQFVRNKELMAAKESRPIIMLYNRVARALVEYEVLWQASWLRGIDAALACLNCTLICYNPESGKYHVNFQLKLLELLREARALGRIGIDVPEAARLALRQEEKFRGYYDRLDHLLLEHEKVVRSVPEVARPLLEPHLAAMEARLRPGATVLTWASMNIDGYLHFAHAGLTQLKGLVTKVADVLHSRAESNLKAVQATRLVDLPHDRTFTQEDFASHQAAFAKRHAERLAIRNKEVERSVDEVIRLLEHSPCGDADGAELADSAKSGFWQHHSQRMHKAMLAATTGSLTALQQRVSGPVSDGVPAPLFRVAVELSVPSVGLNPSSAAIQATIDTAAKQVVDCSKALKVWAGAPGGMLTYHDLISVDADVIQVLHALSGAVEASTAGVADFLKGFNSFAFLWQRDIATEHAKFLAGSPKLEDFEGELKKYLAVERAVAEATPSYRAGALQLDTAPLRASLKAEAAAWKTAFARNLHSKGAEDLQVFEAYVRDTTAKLNGKVADLDDVRDIMATIKEVNDREAEIDAHIVPIEDMYALLARYEVKVPAEEKDGVSDLRQSWKRLRRRATEAGEELHRLQAGFQKKLVENVAALVADARSFRIEWEAHGPMVPGLDPMQAVERLKKFQQPFEMRKRKWDSLASGEELFGLPITQYPGLEKTEQELSMLNRLYSLYVTVITTIRGYGDLFWTDVVAQMDAMNDTVVAFQAQAKKLPKALREWQAFNDCKRTIDDFLDQLPLFKMLAHKAMRPRHWQEIMRSTGKELDLAEDVFKLGHLLEANILAKREAVEDLASAALKEEAIEAKLAAIAVEWGEQTFTFQDYKSRGPVVLKPSETAELVEKLEDAQMALGSMATNRFAVPFRETVDVWLGKLGIVSEQIEQWLAVQNLWMYVEAVFSGGDIVKQLPLEAKRFQNIDKSFMKIVAFASETANVISVCVTSDMLRSLLPALLEQLELCQKSLTAYLETKRAEFPRFYFVSDPTLLEILSLGSDPPSVVPHFQSGLFDSLSNVTFDKADKGRILEMYSQQGEKVELEHPVEAKGMVEGWLQRLVDGMQATMKAIIKRAHRNVYEMGLQDFIFSHPAQVALLGLQFQWTADTQAALVAAKTDKTAMAKAAKKADALLREMVAVTLKSDLSRIQRTNLETCITVHMHQKETSEDLVRKKIRDPTDFEWLKQCRFYWRDDRDTVIISICDVDFEYSFEYLGVKERLVITPLTDVCYVTLSQALGMFLGGAPAGPAGTGKTETTKDLGNTLGKYVVVFNCSDQMDYKGMGKIYKGLAQSGLWGCFDEFNRIDLSVLSVCAQQVYCVLSAIRERRKQFTFTDGSTVLLDPRVGFFITMNPGYAGRQELPENLKALFRGVTMMVPNRQIIMKVKLAACGYQENEVLAKKFHVLYGLCEQQLSKQPHYDFGLRNILSVLRTAGASKRANPDKSEVFLMMRTLRDMNMSKFVAEDVPLFISLIDDLFPAQKADRAQFPDITAALEKVVAERGLQAHPAWMNKCIQLYETYLVRHGIMLVGPSGSGKTTIMECLAAALTELGTKTVLWRMNPKAVTAPQMFGRMDAATGDWTDGIFAVLWRRAAKSKTQNTWIVLDGPVDAIWIENLNTVLDDNKVLTLANGDRILMTGQMKAFFEPENLNNASPATVSRAGIIYVSDTELGWQPMVASWLQARKPAEAALLQPCFDRYVDPMLSYIRANLKAVMHNETACQISTLLTLLEGSLAADPPGTTSTEPLPPAALAVHMERVFVFCLTWSLGGLLHERDRPLFDAELRKLTPADIMPPKGEEGDSVYEYMVREDGGGWRAWRDRVPKWIYPANAERPNFSQLLIPTADSVRYEHLLRLVFSVGKASLLVGGPGTAKTSIINQFMGRFTPEDTTSKTITFSSLTTPAIFQTAVEGCVEKRQGRTYGPVGGKTMAIFVDDLSMPAVNEWGDQVTNEIVRQLLEQGGMYSLEKPIGDMRYIIDTRFVAAMNVPGGGKNDIPNRLKRQFSIFYVPPPSATAVNSIFGALVQGRFDASRFGADVVDLALKLVPATLALWNKVAAKMLPTPAKFHYLFNMRELSKVFQGLLLADRTRFDKTASGGFGGDMTTTAGYLAALWVHECGRVFGDKMITKEDGAWVDNAIRDLARQNFPSEVAAQLKRPLHFVDFLREPTTDPETGEVIDAHPSVYESVPGGLPDIRARAEALQRRFNEESRGSKLELVLFQDALTHLTRISRALAMERGNVLLVGVGGSGKQSLARLAAYIAGAYCFQITITKTYNTSNLFEDLKNLCKIAGVKGQPVAFIFTDAEVKEEGFLEYINQLLMTGEVAGLLPKEELESILNDVRPVFKRECIGVPDTADNLYAFFLGRVRDRLHVILCFSPVGAKFARRAQQFPGLISGCTIDWFLPWPEEALTEVAGKYINDFPMACSDSVKTSLKSLMGSVHVGVTAACQEYYEKFRRHVYVTPKSYMSFLDGFRALYTSKLTETRELAGAINNGLDKMNGAKVDVNRMKGELAIKNVELAAASQEAEKLLKDISESTAVAEKEKAKVAVILDQVSKTASEIAAVKDDAEKDLAAAKPALDAALSALNSITPKDIVALKALKNPPDIVKRIFDCVLLLRYLPVQKVAWQDVKGSQVLVGNYDEAVKMMGDTAFLSSLINFPKEAITDETVELLKPYFKAPDFNFDSAKKASGNVAGLCNWAAAMCTYHDVAKVVEPKIVALRGAENELKSATKEKDAAEAELAIVQSKLDAMQADFDAAMRQKQALEEDAAATKRRMDTANALLGALAGEETRWTEQSKAFDDQIQRLTGDCAIASSFVSYLGPFNKEFRELLLARDLLAGCRRLGIPFTRDLKLSAFLADDAEVGEWTLQGLPTDELSVQNGIMVARASRFPVLIDPQGQGRAWLLQREAPRSLRVTHLPDKNFRNVLEDCLANGKPLLIENIEEELDPILDPVLEKRFIRQARGLTLQLNDKEVEYNESFRLYCTTRLPRPHFTPELSANVTLVDFTVTQAGLEDQLLGKLILKEKTELEEQRLALMEEVQSYRRRIKQLEDDLLFRLSNSQGNLLDDTELIGVLAVTKATAAQVNQKLAGASEARRRISEACEEYRPVAHRAQIIYFLIAQFSTVNCMYQTSLAQFNRLYELAIDTSERAAVSSKRIHNIIEHMTYEIYLYIQRGLFERHKIIFALLLALSVLTSAGKIKPEEVDIFLKGGGALDINSVKKKPKEWIPDAMWLGVVALGSMGAFQDITDSVTRAEGLWRRWYDAEAPERAPVPEYEERLSKFERMCIVRAWREDRALVAAADVIADALGQRFVDSVPLNMERAWAESAPNVPVICLLSPGADPTKLIEDLAKRKKIRTLGVSMGQGQEIIARNLLAAATADGQWLLLQNTHLGLAYLSELEGVLSKTEGVHENFRLWITAEPHPAFPIGLLQMGIKLTNEAPVGMQAGMRASYQWVNQDMLEAVNRHEWRQLLFVTTFLHSIVQERRKFGPIGWNVPYEFNQSDLSACIQFLQNHLLEMDAKRASAPTWETVRYMVSAIQYGGRITDEFDKLLMDTYAEKYFQQGVLIPNYILYKDVKDGAAYSVPQGTEIEIYRKAIEEIPSQDSPELFGLHPNADLTFRTLQVQAAVQLVLETRPQGGAAGGGSSREEVVDKLCEELLSKAPPLFEKEEVREKLRKLPGGPAQPLTVHLRQEIDRINSVILLTVSRLKDLRLAVAGTIALSGQLADSLEALYNARIPRDWLAKSWEASTLGNWFSGLLARHDQLAKWLTSGRPKAYWLTGFFNPQGFLTAVKQEVSRRHAADKWALDDVVLTSEVTHPAKDLDGIKEAPAEGVYVYGLYLDGCAWSAKGNRLIDSEPKKLFNALPVLYVTGVQAKDKKKGGIFEAPVYRVKKRTGLNYITSFPLRTDEPPSKWILRGVALLCSTD